MIEQYEQLLRENRALRAQLKTLTHNHYQAQLDAATTTVAGEIKHSTVGTPVRVALTAEGLSLPHGTLLVAVQTHEAQALDAGEKERWNDT